jgi:hypothetical protein
LVVAAGKDTLMGIELMRQMVADYRRQFVGFVRSLWGVQSEVTGMKNNNELSNDQRGIGFEAIQGSGHHIQNDIHWEDCAGKILVFLDQL